MSKIILKIVLILSIFSVIIVLTGMTLNLKSDKKSNQRIDQDTLKAENYFKIDVSKDQSVKFSLNNSAWFYNKSNPYFKLNDTIEVRTRDFGYNFNDYEFNNINGDLIENKGLIIPEELNLYNSKSNTQDLKSLMNFTIDNLGENNSWWRYYSFNVENDIDNKMMVLFHDLMKNKVTREIIYAAVKENYSLLNTDITVFQKRLIVNEIKELISFCINYPVNRKKYLNGRTSVTEKPGEYDFSAEYGYETRSEGFLFRRIEFDGVPPSELAQFLREFQKIIYNSLNSSDYNSNMSCEFNGGKLKINSYANSKNKIGFLLRTINNNGSYFIPSESIKITKLEIKGKDFWRILYDQGRAFITLDENLKKV